MSARTLRNPIMRQLQRHARLAAIYRVADGPGSGASAGPAGFGASAGTAPAPTPARAYLWPVADEQPAADDTTMQPEAVFDRPVAPLPAQAAQPPTAQSPSAAPLIQRAPATSPQTAAPRPAATARPAAAPSAAQGPAVNRPAPKPIQSAPAAAESPAAPAATPAESADEMDPSTWRRLETIFRKHQEAEVGASEAATGSNQPASPAEPAAAAAPAAAALAGVDEPSTAPDVQDAASAPTLIQRTAATAPSSDRSPAAAVPPASRPAPVQRAPDAPARVDSTTDTDPFLPGWSDDAAPAGIQPEDASVNPSPDANLPARQPLEAVWPVERSSPPAARSGPAVSGPSSVQGQEPDPGEAAQLRSTLAQVSPEQISASSIELVPTRRPRPIPLTPPGAENQPIQAAPAIQKQAMESSRPAPSAADLSPDLTAPVSGLDRSAYSPAGGAGLQSAETGFPADAPTGPIRIQRAADAEAHPAAPTGATTPAGMVPTDIGALPADLWTLIGQSVPQSAPQPAPRPDQPPTAAPEPAPAASDAISLSANRVQRAEADDNPAPAQSGGQTGLAPSGQAQAAGQPNQPDIDQLARSVYAEVKRRLHQEWERMRHR